MRNTAERLSAAIDRAIAAIGRAAAWCCLYVVLAEFAVVVLRYALGLGSIRLQESVLYAHAALFMLAAAWTLQVGGHVRVDVFYAQASLRTRAVIDLVGTIVFLFPVAIAIAVLSLSYVDALLGDPRTIARNKRPAVHLSAQDADPAICAVDRLARHSPGDPRSIGAVQSTRPHPTLPRKRGRVGWG